MISMKRNGFILIFLILCSLCAMGQLVRESGRSSWDHPDSTSMFCWKYSWNLSRIVNMMDWIEEYRIGCSDSVYASEIDAIYAELKTYRERPLNYALLDKQINLINIQLDKTCKESYQRSSPYGLVRKEILSKKKPDETDHLILDGIGFWDENKPDKAYQCFQKAIEKDSARLNYYYFVIMAEMVFTRDTAKALESLDKVISRSKGLNISTFNPYLTRAWIYTSRKQFIPACQDLNRVLEKDTDNQQALFTRGYIKTQLKDFTGSVSDYQKVLKYLQFKPFRVDGDSALIINNIGWNYYFLKEYKLCVQYACKSLQLKPDDPNTLDTRGSGYFGLGEYEKCIDDMTKGIRLKPEQANSWYLRGLSYLKLNKKDQACADLSKAAGLGVVEAEEAMKGLGISPANIKFENQRQFPNGKLSNSKNRVRVDANGIHFSL